jgi:thioredoxin reductase (NADPH)
MAQPEEVAFPQLTASEIALVRPLAERCEYADGQIVFHAGQPEVDLYIVESGEIEIHRPIDGVERVVVAHGPGQFSGDIDLLTGRPVLVNGIARGPTSALRIPHHQVRSLLNRIPSFGEKLILAFTRRRELLAQLGNLGLLVVGPGRCRDTNTVREFLYKNFVPFTWHDTESDAGRKAFMALGSPRKTPVIKCNDGQVLTNPTLQELALAAGIWQCPNEEADLVIIGAGPAGLTAAVYAASEGISTLILDKLGPGGQAGSSSRIENFIGFPAGLSGADLATRGVLQMLKFGASIFAPVAVSKMTPAQSINGLHTLELDCGEKIQCKVLLLALGVHWRKLEAAGADRFAGAGIYYACTTVEGDLYDQCDVAVVGGGNSAGQAVMFLAECCPNRQVHLIIRRTLGPGMSEYLSQRIRAAPNVTIHEHTEIATIEGGRRMETITLKNSATKAERSLPCSAVFVFIGADPAADWLPTNIARDTNGYLLTGTDVVRSGKWPRSDRDPCPLETSVPGILAAGDIRSGSTKRVGFAVGDGSLAVTCAHRLLSISR